MHGQPKNILGLTYRPQDVLKLSLLEACSAETKSWIDFMYIVMHGTDNPKMICCQGFRAKKLSGKKRSQKSRQNVIH